MGRGGEGGGDAKSGAHVYRERHHVVNYLTSIRQRKLL